MKKILLYFFVITCAANLTAQSLYFEDFEGDATWTTIDADGDGFDWQIANFSTAAVPPPIGAGGLCISSASWDATAGPLNPKNILFLPEIDLTDATGDIILEWYAYAQDQDWTLENYKVVVATEATEAGADAGTILYEGNPGVAGGYAALTAALNDFYGSKIFIGFVHYNVTDQFRLNIDGIQVYEPKENNVDALTIFNQTYEPLNVDIPVSFRMQNVGINDVTSFTATYTYGANAPVEEVFTASVGLKEEADFTFTERLNIAASSSEMLEVVITKVNSEDDADPSANTVAQRLITVTDIPFKSVLIEEGTGTWCPWCPRGAVGLESVTSNHSDAIGIAVHNGPTQAPDPMDFGDYDTQLINQVNGGGYPFSGIDRAFEIDPNANDLELAYAFSKTINAPVSVDANALYDGQGNITVNVSAEVKAAVMSGDYRFAVVLTEDGLSGTTSGWAQANNYSGGQFGVMGGYELLPNPVPASQMVYDHVARMLLGGFEGMANSFPADVVAGESHSWTFETAIPADYRITQMHAVALFIDASTGVVLNSKQVSIDGAVNTNTVFEHSLAKVYPNPFSSVANIELSVEGSQQVNMFVMNSLGQKVAQRNYGTLSGKTILPFNGSTLENGVYYFHIQVGEKLVTKKLMLNK